MIKKTGKPKEGTHNAEVDTFIARKLLEYILIRSSGVPKEANSLKQDISVEEPWVKISSEQHQMLNF